MAVVWALALNYDRLSSWDKYPAFESQVVHGFYLLGGLALDGFDEALVKLRVYAKHVGDVVEAREVVLGGTSERFSERTLEAFSAVCENRCNIHVVRVLL
ncbi:hypothetical protein [Enteroscipio rubneri]|uniref:hypothetical protein n=1 Tax=Enteroscipio rubneri TaxID=2070686 RepID=UPI00164D907B|nr:hypothetical protein [Enteroscipio rubneri]